MPLSALNQAAFNRISRSDVETTLRGTRRFAKEGRWLSKDNWYQADAAKKVKDDIDAGAITKPRNLAQYIAVSTLLHCADGWSYLGRAVHSLLRGDPHRARHLAYYAELRATMSLMAGEGIGIFNNSHAMISAPNLSRPVHGRTNTHSFVWDCLAYWAQKTTSGELFAATVRPYGRTLEDWLTPIGGNAAVGAQAQKWFTQWGMDLESISKDRHARNHSSYRPEGIPDHWNLLAPETTKVVADIWASLEPASNSAFEFIDRQILRLTLESIQKSRSGQVPSADPVGFGRLVQSVVDYQNLSPRVATWWSDFLLRRSSPDDDSIFVLSRVPPSAREKSAYAIVSRAVLMLRMASGSTSALFNSAGFDSDVFAFWWKDIGPARGLWKVGGEPDSSIDLWSDIRQSLDDVAQFQREYTGDEHSFYNLGNQLGVALSGLAGFERAMIWSMVPA